ncbi:MAG TPA: hypothetical protein VHQ65_16560 [Thermoanaerobaculia bacterium]|nr:hypothetical protein [Thermoanaerobaculia bacterium]
MTRSIPTPNLSAFACAVVLFAGAAAGQTTQPCGDSERQAFQADANAGLDSQALAAKWAHCNTGVQSVPSNATAGPLEVVTAASKVFLNTIGSTFYEQLNSCGYHPQGEIVTCDVEVKRTTWYGTFPAGSNEYVRFCFDCNNDGLWENSTLGIVHVTNDISAGPLPFYFNAYATTHQFCPQNDGQDFRIRALLAWQQPLTHGACGQPAQVVWGNGIDFTARRDP